MHTPSQRPQPGIPAGSAQPTKRPAVTDQSAGLMKAMSPGVVDYLFRQLVAGESPEDVQWQKEGITLSAQPPGAELARRLTETDLDALTPTELFHYVRAAQRLASWAEALREAAVARYCQPVAPPGRSNGTKGGRSVRGGAQDCPEASQRAEAKHAENREEVP